MCPKNIRRIIIQYVAKNKHTAILWSSASLIIPEKWPKLMMQSPKPQVVRYIWVTMIGNPRYGWLQCAMGTSLRPRCPKPRRKTLKSLQKPFGFVEFGYSVDRFPHCFYLWIVGSSLRDAQKSIWFWYRFQSLQSDTIWPKPRNYYCSWTNLNKSSVQLWHSSL